MRRGLSAQAASRNSGVEPARGAKVIVVATEGDEEINKIADCIIRVPAVRDVFSPITCLLYTSLAENRTWIQSHVGTELTDREETLLMFMREHGCVCDVQKIREALK